jgi:hypothetical protein
VRSVNVVMMASARGTASAAKAKSADDPTIKRPRARRVT